MQNTSPPQPSASAVKGPPRSRRAASDKAARWTAVIVAILGAAVVLWPAIHHFRSAMNADPFQHRTATSTVITIQAGKPTSTTITKTEAKDAFEDRVLSAGGVFMLRLGFVFLAAFLAGALMQRAWLGEFALKVGVVEVPGLPEAAKASEQALDALVQGLENQKEATVAAMRLSAETALRLADLEQRVVQRPRRRREASDGNTS